MAMATVTKKAFLQFPKFEANGPLVAAMLAIVTGLLVMAFVNIGTDMSAGFKDTVHGIGKAWIPNAQGIGPYSGKETLMLLGWLGSWPLYHLLLRRRELNLKVWFLVFVVGVAVAALLVWPPVTVPIANALAGR